MHGCELSFKTCMQNLSLIRSFDVVPAFDETVMIASLRSFRMSWFVLAPSTEFIWNSILKPHHCYLSPVGKMTSCVRTPRSGSKRLIIALVQRKNTPWTALHLQKCQRWHCDHSCGDRWTIVYFLRRLPLIVLIEFKSVHQIQSRDSGL